ncbi:MAG: hypothetical protein H6920_11315 [Sphingomonadaceae bacterium]|nr:hypothetical protein [Sphingomonadaceae bacterium]MCP5383502.1 hypothetical protein [Altererythrobacter sp.]MCP5392195.1 hypothetical protein [Sphingomonadaceae bacterium]MCP5394444.1 hypothetical protein [Sphingomonadaceae bacterium]
MSVDPFPAPVRRSIVRGLNGRLRRAVQALSDGLGTVAAHSERPWASITFAGSRHRLRIEFSGAQEVEAGERLIAELPEHEFALVGQLVADANVVGVEHTMLPEPKLVIDCEILLLEEG